MKTREDFEVYLEQELVPLLESERAKHDELEALRASVRLPGRTKGAIIGVGFVASLAIGSFAVLMGALLLPFMIDGWRMGRVKGPKPMDVRSGLIRRVIEFWGPEFEYLPWGGATRAEVEASRLIPEAYDRFSSSDQVSGKYHATTFRFSG